MAAEAIIFPAMALSNSSLDEPAGRASIEFSANRRKKYRCVPWCGHEPPKPIFPKLVFPSVAPADMLFSPMPGVFGSMFQIVQWMNRPRGESGSSMTNASDLASEGTPENE